jgi:hypothetical protein
VTLVKTDVLEESINSFTTVTRIGELEATLTVTTEAGDKYYLRKHANSSFSWVGWIRNPVGEDNFSKFQQ